MDNKTLHQFIKFGFVGIGNTIITFIVYYILIFFSVPYSIANIIGYTVGILNSYFWNSKYVFKTSGNKVFVKTFISYSITIVISTLSLYIIIDMCEVSKYIAPIINILIITPINFMLNKYWAFKKKRNS